MTRFTFACLFLAAAAGDLAAQSTPAAAQLTRWDIHAVTGGTIAPADGTHKLSGIGRDGRGNVWVIGQGNGNVRVGRIDTTSPAGETYTEWKVFQYGEDGEPRGLLVTPNDDVWLAVGGIVPFVRKLAESNTFLDFRRDGAPIFSPHAMAHAADGSTIFVAGAEPTGQGYIVMIDASLAGPGEVTLPAWTAPSAERAFQPQYVAIDGTPGVVWFTNSGDPLNPGSTVGRLDIATGHVLEWPVSGLDAAGLHVNGSRVCVVTRGSLAQPPIPPGEVECLLIPADNPATADNEMATTPATHRRFSRSADGALDLPEQIVGGVASSLFVTERGGNAVVFIGDAAVADAVDGQVTPMSLQLEPAALGGFRVQDDWEGPNSPRLDVPLPSTPISIAGTSIGTGQARFEFFSAPQEMLEPLLRHPHPAAITPLFYPDGPGGYGTVFVAESFHDLRGATYLGGRVDRFELTVPVLKVTDGTGNDVSTLSVSADLADSPAPAIELIVSNGGAGELDWVASVQATGFSMTIAPISSGVVSGTQSASIILTAIPASAGHLSGAVTISSPSTLQQVVIPITFTVTRPAAITADRTELTFQTNRLLSPSDTVRLTNVPYGRAIGWAASGPSWAGIGPGTGTIAGGQDLEVTITIDPAGLPLDVPQTAEVTFFDPANPSAADTRVVVPVTVTVTAPKIVLDQTSIEVPAIEDNGTATHVVTLTNAGTGPLNPIMSVTPGATWLGASLADDTPIPAGQSRTFTVAVDTFGLAAGTVHTGVVTVGDPAAADLPLHLFQPGQQIAVSVEVAPLSTPPQLVLSPTALTFETARGHNPASQTVTISNPGGLPLNVAFDVSTADGAPWLVVTTSATEVAPQGTATLLVTPVAAPLAAGTYTGIITVRDASAGLSGTVSVMLIVRAGDLAITPPGLTFDAPRWTDCNGSWSGSNPASQGLILTNTTDRPVWFLVVSGESWLSAAPLRGVVPPRKTRTVRVSTDATGLLQGTYAGQLTVYTLTNPSQSHVIDSEVVPVTLNVGPAPARLCVAPASLDFGTLGRNALSGARTITVENVGDVGLAWSATATASDGTVTLTMSGSTLQVVIGAGTKKGAQTGTVTISAPGMPSQTVNLDWRVN